MSHFIPEEVQDRMLFAVNNYDESHSVTADGTLRDYNKDTKEFFDALAEWGPKALFGDFHMFTNTETGERTITFRPGE